MGAQGIVRHQLRGHLVGQLGREAARHVDRCQLQVFGFRLGLQLNPFTRQVGPLGVGLRRDRHVFAGRHGHRTGHQGSNARDQQFVLPSAGRRHAQHEAGGGDDAVIGAQHGGAQPAYAFGAVQFGVGGARHDAPAWSGDEPLSSTTHTGAKPPPGVRKFVVWPEYMRAANNCTCPL